MYSTLRFDNTHASFNVNIDGAGNDGWIIDSRHCGFSLEGREMQIVIDGGSGTTRFKIDVMVPKSGEWRNVVTNKGVGTIQKISDTGDGATGISPLFVSSLRVTMTAGVPASPILVMSALAKGL